MAGSAAVITAVVAVVSAAGTVYTMEQAADDRREEEKRLKQQAEREARLHTERSEKLIGKQRALFAASGVRVDSGSPLAVLKDTEEKAASERAEILKAYGYKADALGSEASRLSTQGYVSGSSTLLSGAADFSANPQNPFA